MYIFLFIFVFYDAILILQWYYPKALPLCHKLPNNYVTFFHWSNNWFKIWSCEGLEGLLLHVLYPLVQQMIQHCHTEALKPPLQVCVFIQTPSDRHIRRPWVVFTLGAYFIRAQTHHLKLLLKVAMIKNCVCSHSATDCAHWGQIIFCNLLSVFLCSSLVPVTRGFCSAWTLL